MLMSLKRIFIGRPLKSTELSDKRLSKTKALAILSSDALSSVAYGPEQILIVLMAVGAAALWYSLPIAIGVVVLLTALILSYRQVIHAYPHGGGAYIVSKENLGLNAGLVAGGALLVDYMLTVAVSVSAGADAITSAFPSLHPYNLELSILFVIVLMILNLRGLTESATVLAYPVYLFIGAMFLMLIVGLFKVVTGQAHVVHTPIGTPVAGISLFLLLKAFASGSSALTGVEAISNSVPNFRKSEPLNATKTLMLMGLLLAMMFSGIVYLTYAYGLMPQSANTIVSQLAEAIVGHGVFYYIIQAVTALILVLAANTGFSVFPMLAVSLSKDGYLPRMLQMRGDRLGYSNGILMLGLGAILLLIIFKGKTTNLIPLYAVGVFIPFTLAQTGMFMKWLRERPKGFVVKMVTNLVGALISCTVAMIFFLTKFSHVWPVLIFLPIMTFIFYKIHRHYEQVNEAMKLQHVIDIKEGNIFILPVAGMTSVVEHSLNYARSLNPGQIIAVHVCFEKEECKLFEEQWRNWQPNTRIVAVYSPYRTMLQPMTRVIDRIQKIAKYKDAQVSIVIPQFLPEKRWQYALHNQTGVFLRTYLLYRKDVAIITVPYHIGLKRK